MGIVEESLAGPMQGREVVRLFIGFSGGLDSTVLLHAARAVWTEQSLIALHVNHGLQPQSDQWETHCREVCKRLGIDLFVCGLHLDNVGNPEARARTGRYNFFCQHLEAQDLLLLAHHRHDQAETILLRLLQGRGLIGMPEERPLGNGRLLRPFLNLPKETLVEYAEVNRLSWVEDPSNSDETLDRNYLRHRVLPGLRKHWPKVDSSLLDLAIQHREQDAALGMLAGLEDTGLELSITSLERYSDSIQTELLRVWLSRLGEYQATRKALHNFLQQLKSASHRQPTLELRFGNLRRFRGMICYVSEVLMPEAEYALNVPGSVTLPHGELQVVAADKEGFTINGKLRLVFRRGGERILVRGTHRSVKKILQEKGIPPWQRDRYPLLADDDGLLAVGNLAYRDSDAQRGAGASLWQANWEYR